MLLNRKSYWSLAVAFVLLPLVLGFHPVQDQVASRSAEIPQAQLEPSLWGDANGPCEELTNPFPKEYRITIELNQRERELIHLAMDGFIADLDHELTGINNAGSEPLPFAARSFFLGYFINTVVPTIQARVGAAEVDDFPTPENEAAMAASIQVVEFTACERVGLSIAIENWSVNAGGTLQRHLRLCDKSQEINGSTACASFRPLGEAYNTLTKKIEKDQK